MKKRKSQLKSALTLNKKTIANLGLHDLSLRWGGNPTNGKKCVATNGHNCTDSCIWCCTGHQCSYPGGCTGICTV